MDAERGPASRRAPRGGILDSISTLKLVVFLEEKFEVTIEAYEAGVEHLDSVGQIARLIAEKKAA